MSTFSFEIEGSYRAQVRPVPPTYIELQRQFTKLDRMYKQASFEPFKGCAIQYSSEEEIELTFRFLRVTCGKPTLKRVRAAMWSNGLRPTLLSDVVGFDRAYPAMHRDDPIVSVGSRTKVSYRINSEFDPQLLTIARESACKQFEEAVLAAAAPRYYLCVPCLYGGGHTRGLRLLTQDNDWGHATFLAAVVP